MSKQNYNRQPYTHLKPINVEEQARERFIYVERRQRDTKTKHIDEPQQTVAEIATPQCRYCKQDMKLLDTTNVTKWFICCDRLVRIIANTGQVVHFIPALAPAWLVAKHGLSRTSKQS